MSLLPRAFLVGLALIWHLGVPAQGLLEVPPLAARVVDQTGTLNAQALQTLEARLAALEQARGAQVVVLLVPTTQPEDIASYANRIANAWKIGRRDVGDGVLLVVAKNDRKVRIEVAKALEGAIPDLAAKMIIDESITPRFRQNDFAGGLEAAVGQLERRIGGEALPAPAADHDKGVDWFDWGIFLFFAVPIVTPLARRLFGIGPGALVTGSVVGGLAWLLSTSLLVAGIATLLGMLYALFATAGASLGQSSGHQVGGSTSSSDSSWDSGGGGGFSSGGGGDFGGGGASGDW